MKSYKEFLNESVESDILELINMYDLDAKDGKKLAKDIVKLLKMKDVDTSKQTQSKPTQSRLTRMVKTMSSTGCHDKNHSGGCH